jgi:hypothetical protein
MLELGHCGVHHLTHETVKEFFEELCDILSSPIGPPAWPSDQT